MSEPYLSIEQTSVSPVKKCDIHLPPPQIERSVSEQREIVTAKREVGRGDFGESLKRSRHVVT